MTCQTVMLPDPISVRDTTPLAEAIDLLFHHRIKNLPVVDQDRIYRGLFGIHTLIRQLLPRAATLDEGAGLTDLGFVHDTLDNLRDRLAGRMQEPVLQFADRTVQPVAPDASIMETLLRLHRQRAILPVVEPATGRLLGIVTYWELLARLAGRTA